MKDREGKPVQPSHENETEANGGVAGWPEAMHRLVRITTLTWANRSHGTWTVAVTLDLMTIPSAIKCRLVCG